MNMLKNGFTLFCSVFLTLVLPNISIASEVIELPQEELAQESVLPIFDKTVGVKNRNIVTDGRVDFNFFYGYALTEAIANVSKMGLGIYYNLGEDHAVGLLVANNFSGQSDYAKQIVKESPTLDFNRAPMPKNVYLADYNLKAFYGKMSLSKSVVVNTILYGSGSLGVVQYDHKSYPAVAVGLGQKFYFSKNWALRFDLRLYTNQGPIPFLAGKMKTSEPRPRFDEFSERVLFTTNLDVGLSYLF